MQVPHVRVCLGFDVEGVPKYRAVDDFTRSGMNACTAPAEKLSCDTLDVLFDTLRVMTERLEVWFINTRLRVVPHMRGAVGAAAASQSGH